MKVIVTGAAGFIGFSAARALLDRGVEVVGVDNVSAYYDVALKQARLAEIEGRSGFAFERTDIVDKAALAATFARHRDATHVLHLAAQAGVRHAFDHPDEYVQINIVGHFNIIEVARGLPRLEHIVYASTSSVYGLHGEVPYVETDPVDRPASLYAATKKADELLSFTYSYLHRMPMTALRFFTVYGPWGRPDMSMWLFTDSILNGRPISLFNFGDMSRDFTYIDDIVAGIVAALERVPTGDGGEVPHRVYNLGNHETVPLTRFVEILEQACGRKAEITLAPMPPGDVKVTYADIESARRDLGFEPQTSLETGAPRFVEWYRRYAGL